MSKRMYHSAARLLCVAAAAVLLGGCGEPESYQDGVYEGRSEVFISEDGEDEGNGYGIVTITITDGKIADCTFVTYEPDGTQKDESYGLQDGSVANKDYYNKAQKAVAACQEYADMLVANGSVKGIDAISGATKNYNQFLEAVDDALSKAGS